MSFLLIKRKSFLRGGISLPGDKSIAHRAIIIAALCNAKTVIENFPASKDCIATIQAFKKLGAKITIQPKSAKICVFGKGLNGFQRPYRGIFINESGTTLRLIMGILAGQDFETRLVAGKSLARRPMRRVTEPLRLMGADIKARIRYPQDTQYSIRNTRYEEYPPIIIYGKQLKPITYRMPIASAQVKSAILLAGLYTKGETVIIEPAKTRDHTELMLKLFGIKIKTKGDRITVRGNNQLKSPGKIYIPGDISSAGFFIAGATIMPGSLISIKKLGLNPTRIGVISALKRMGADIRITGVRRRGTGKELMGNVVIKYSKLKGVVVKKAEIPSLIDELPVLMVAACFAKGKTTLKGVKELRVKETDRIKSMCSNLTKMGASIKVISRGKSEDIVVYGVEELKGAHVKSFGDHRTAMSMVIAGLASSGTTRIDDIEYIDKSFPEFFDILKPILRTK